MQKAIFVKELGKPVELGEREIPSPKANEVKVKVTAAMILPHDVYGRDWGLFIGGKLQAVLGSNIAGVVEKIGDGVNSCAVGDKVFGISNIFAPNSDQAGLQEYAILEDNALCKTPDGFSDEQVVTLPVNLVTSAIALFTKPEGFGFPVPGPGGNSDNDGASIVIIGGGTNVGKFAVQLARIAGIGKIIVIAGLANSDQLKSLGATHVVDRRGSNEDIAKQVQSIMGSDGATHVYDCANRQHDLAAAVLSQISPSVLRTLLPMEEDDAKMMKSARPQCDAAFVACANATLVSQIPDFWAHVSESLEGRRILPAEYRVVKGLDKVKEIDAALDAYQDGARSGPQTVVKM